MLEDRIATLFALLDCNNSDIARCLDYSPSNISRIRTGKRTYKPSDRPIQRLADGVYSFADDKNMLRELSELCGSKLQCREELVPALIAWMFDTNVAALQKAAEPSTHTTKNEREQRSRSFGEKLNAVMELLELSNIRLSRQINVDPSHVSRFRNGVRYPKKNSTISGLLSASLFNRAAEQNRLPELSGLIGIEDEAIEDEKKGLSIFSAWLYDIGDEQDTSKVDRFLDMLDSFSPSTKAPLPDLSSFARDDIIMSNRAVYWGTEGLREAVVRFLGSAVKQGGELWLYSDADMSWLSGDHSFFMKWYSLMLACIKQGVRIKIIHNIDRDAEELISSLQSWLPLYMSGMIEPYVCRCGRDTRFSHTIFLAPGLQGIHASHVKGLEGSGWYDYVNDGAKLSALADEYKRLLSMSQSLMKIWLSDTDTPPALSSTNNITALLSSLSPATLPEKLLKDILKRNSIGDESARKITTFCHGQRKTLSHALTKGSVHELISLPTDEELYDGKVRLNLVPALFDEELFYTPDEYAVHIRSVIELHANNAAYHLYMLREPPFTNIQIVLSDEKVSVLRSYKPLTAFSFSDPMMLRAFEYYFDMLKSHHKADRDETRQSLQRFL